jgi:hypothetical protein
MSSRIESVVVLSVRNVMNDVLLYFIRCGRATTGKLILGGVVVRTCRGQGDSHRSDFLVWMICLL